MLRAMRRLYYETLRLNADDRWINGLVCARGRSDRCSRVSLAAVVDNVANNSILAIHYILVKGR
jgi:hypothetical protein